MNELIRTLLLLSASGSVLGLVLMLARRLTGRRLPATLWYYAWLPVLLRLVLPLPGLIPAAQEAPSPAPETVLSEQAEPRPYSYDRYDGGRIPKASAAAAADEARPADSAAPAQAVPSSGQASPAAPGMRIGELLRDPSLWLGIWLAGAAVSFGLYTAGYFRFRRALARTLVTADGGTARAYAGFGLANGPKLVSSVCVKTPMLLGLVRPLIVLPADVFSPEAAHNILCHELTHYRRGDLYVKWFFVIAASLHWFNPLMPLFRHELDRVCELSCDEAVMSRMEPPERRSYGETLLDLASNRALPAGVVATTFATEKRALKERLEHIMKFNWKPRAILALTVAALLLVCGAALAAAPARAASAGPSADSPAPTPMPPAQAASAEAAASASREQKTVNVSAVDEFLAAIGSDTHIVLAPGTYDLSTAADYGRGHPMEETVYHWEEVSDGFELVIEGVENFSVTADDPAAVTVEAVPRYADVMELRNCRDITLSGFTAGHTKEQSQCAGGVIHLLGTDNVSVSDCALFGCGVLGVEAENCRNLTVADTDIYECSDGAFWLTSCRNVRFDQCTFRDCFSHYNDVPYPAFQLFRIVSCRGVAITDSEVHGNYTRELLNASYSQEVLLLGTLFENNNVTSEEDWYSGAVLTVEGYPVTVAGCEFRDSCPIFTDGESTTAADMDGNALSYEDLAAMKLSHVEFPGFTAEEEISLERTLNADGVWAVHVSTVDELLAAIAPDTIVYLDEGLYDLTMASGYGAYGGQYYYWDEMYDGPCLVITGADNLSIVGAGKDATRIEAMPRYASVLRFDYCDNVTVGALTAGHTLGAGSCAGSVLEFRCCEGINVGECGLFGCGVYGVEAFECSDITVKHNTIYQCSYGAVNLSQCADAVFEDNDIYDCAYPTYGIYESLNVTIDGEAVAEDSIEALGAEDPILPAYIEQEAAEGGSPIYQEALKRGGLIFTANIDIPGAGPYVPANG